MFAVSADLGAAALCALAGVLAGVLAPRVIAGLREPEREAPGPPRPSYLQIAATPRLAVWLSVLGGCVGAFVGWQIGWQPVLAAWVYLTAACLILGFVDSRTRLLPTQLIAPSYGIVVVLLIGAALADRGLHGLWHATLGWMFMGGFYYLMWRLGPRGLGYGDVRLSGLLALPLGYLGWGPLVTGLYAGFLLGGLGSLALLLGRRVNLKTQIPFGPYMMVGALVGLAFGHHLSGWYLSR